MSGYTSDISLLLSCCYLELRAKAEVKWFNSTFVLDIMNQTLQDRLTVTQRCFQAPLSLQLGDVSYASHQTPDANTL